MSNHYRNNKYDDNLCRTTGPKLSYIYVLFFFTNLRMNEGLEKQSKMLVRSSYDRRTNRFTRTKAL